MTFDFLEHAPAEPGTYCAGRMVSLVTRLHAPSRRKRTVPGSILTPGLLVRSRPFDRAKPRRQVQGRTVAPVAALGKRPLATFLIVHAIAALTLGGLLVAGT